VLNDSMANDVRCNGTRSSGTDDNRVKRALVRNEMYLKTLRIVMSLLEIFW